jgi:hypothetical protein
VIEVFSSLLIIFEPPEKKFVTRPAPAPLTRREGGVMELTDEQNAASLALGLAQTLVSQNLHTAQQEGIIGCIPHPQDASVTSPGL